MGKKTPRLIERWHTPCFERLCKLDWPYRFTVRSFGVKIAIKVDNPQLLQSIYARLPAHVTVSQDKEVDCVFSLIEGGRNNDAKVRTYSLLYHNHTMVVRSMNHLEVLERFDSYFMLATAQLAPDHVFVHSSAVCINGQAILAPGKTLSGKTTIAHAFVESGAEYLSDEYAIIAKDGKIHAYPRPLSVRNKPEEPQLDVCVSTIGGTTCRKPVPASVVLLTSFKPNAQWCPTHLTKGEGILRVMEHCIGAQYDPARVLATLNKAFANTKFLKSHRGDVWELVSTFATTDLG